MALELVRVFEHDPELLGSLRGRAAVEARRSAVARVIHLSRGEWRPPVVRLGPQDLALLLLNGMAIRRIEVAGRAGIELLGAGDIIRPWRAEQDEDSSIPSASLVKVSEPTHLAVLDRDFAATIARWPEIIAQLLERCSARSASLTFQLAIAQLPRLETRLHFLLWHLADRWGHVDRDGVVLHIRLTQETLADLTSARRASVSSALGRLTRRGLVRRLGRGQYRLYGAPPTDDAHARGSMSALA